MTQDREIDAMAAIAAALGAFGDSEEDRAALTRILQWACSRYSVAAIVPHEDAAAPGSPEELPSGSSGDFADIADLFHAANPRSGPEKALVVAYWLTRGEDKPVFGSLELNKQLKNLGYGVANITDALTTLMRRKPALVMQVAKSGTSRQARKKYKLTRAGLDEVSRMAGLASGTE